MDEITKRKTIFFTVEVLFLVILCIAVGIVNYRIKTLPFPTNSKEKTIIENN